MSKVECNSEIISEEEDEDEALLVDGDICNALELQSSFQMKYKIADEIAVSLKAAYVLSLCQDSGLTCIGVGLSNACTQLIKVGERGLSTLATIDAPAAATQQKISTCGVRFLDETSNCLLVGSTNGLVRLYDVRASTQVAQACFVDTISGNKGILCFDRNANARILCTGSGQQNNLALLNFYDLRERKQLGVYSDSHQDDITAVCFHAENPDRLSTGSMDGLINVFDIIKYNEDDALMTTINTESSVDKLNWHSDSTGKDCITCVTHTNDFMAYENDGDLVAKFERAHITESLKRKSPANCNLIAAHSTELRGGDIFLLGGTNFNKGDTLRSVRVQGEKLQPLANFEGNKQIVRSSLYDCTKRMLITAGECGIVSLWSTEQAPPVLESMSQKLKTKTKTRSGKTTPY